VARSFATDLHQGLSLQQARELLVTHGPNEWAAQPPAPRWKRFLAQFQDLIIGLLLAAAAVSAFAGQWLDALVILAIIILNGILGFIQEDRATRALLSLQKLSTPHAKAIRSDNLVSLPARELVPGDLVAIETGDWVPADLRLTHSINLRTQESALTDESVPVEKNHATVLDENTPLADRQNMAFMGTSVAAGKATGIVVATGMRTQIGHIAGLIQRQPPQPTPLQLRLKEMSRTLLLVVIAAVVLIFLLQLVRGGKPLELFLISVSLAVAAVPEGLPAIVTIALALGVQRMVKRNVLIRKLPSVETLGSVTVICSDKTGTLTRNEMTVTQIIVSSGRYHVTGAGWEPMGEFLANGSAVSPQDLPDLRQALIIAACCNHAHIVTAPNTRAQIVGDPTEAALLVAAFKAGLPAPSEPRQILHEIPFDSDRKMMSVVLADPSGGFVLYSKGAPEAVLGRCSHELVGDEPQPLTESRKSEILQASHSMAQSALRVLAVAYRIQGGANAQEIPEEDLIFTGLFGMIDPPREEARAAVQQCHRAGIRPVMITGDHPATARAIASALGIASEEQQVISGQQLDNLSDDALAQRVENIAVCARVTADHKLRVVRALKSRDHVVAMTGDGVNDAPAIKAADIGIAMGINGTDVSKEAAAMVLLDDNFASIVAAVEEGRGIYDNIRKFIHYLLASNSSEIMLMLAVTLVGWPAPLLAIQILWINLITDGLPALALGVEPAERDIMTRPPRPAREPIITRRSGLIILLHGLLLAAAGVAGYLFTYTRDSNSLPVARTVTFCTIALAQLFYAVSCRSPRWTWPQLGAFTNIYVAGAMLLGLILQIALATISPLRHLFKLAPLSLHQWLLIFLLALTPVTIIEVGKLIAAHHRR
jgi:Ca2+-transporting ATPase